MSSRFSKSLPEKTLAHSSVRRRVIGAILTRTLIGSRFPNKYGCLSLVISWNFSGDISGLRDLKWEHNSSLIIYKSVADPLEAETSKKKKRFKYISQIISASCDLQPSSYSSVRQHKTLEL